jgi:hypothetical protein
MILYHATYEALLPSIRKHGLCRDIIQIKSWLECSSGYVYLHQNADAAASFCEASENVPAEWLEKIVVLSVNADVLDACLFELDENIRDSTRLVSYQYRGDIPLSAIFL